MTLKTRPCAKLSDAVLTSTHPGLFAKGRQQEILARFEKSVRMTRFGGDCYGYCLLAAGFVDLIIEPSLKTYDIAPLIPIIERAGAWSRRGRASLRARVATSSQAVTGACTRPH